MAPEDLYTRVAALRTDAFELIDEVQGALRSPGTAAPGVDLAATLASLQGVANRLGSAEASLAPRADGPAG
jgi:hypothetical protein